MCVEWHDSWNSSMQKKTHKKQRKQKKPMGARVSHAQYLLHKMLKVFLLMFFFYFTSMAETSNQLPKLWENKFYTIFPDILSKKNAVNRDDKNETAHSTDKRKNKCRSTQYSRNSVCITEHSQPLNIQLTEHSTAISPIRWHIRSKEGHKICLVSMKG